MTLQDLPPSLSIIAERHLARAKATLEERGIDTAGMLPAEIFDRAKQQDEATRPPLGGEGSAPGNRRSGRRLAGATGLRRERPWRRDWRRRLRPRSKAANDIPEPD